MRALSYRTFCSFEGRQVGLLHLPARWRYTTELKPLESWVQGPGAIAFFLPGEIHHTRCVAADRAVVVRLEGQKLAGMLRHRYDPQTNTAELYTSEA